MRRALCFLCALALLLCGCAARDVPQDDGRLRVVTTLYPYYDFACRIAGEHADVTLLLSPGREAHSFEPTPLDAVTIAHADVFLYNGGESEVWVDDMLDAAGEEIAVVRALLPYADALEEEYTEGMQGGHDEHEHDEHTHDDHDHDAIAYDEHVWTSPQNAKKLCAAICEALCEADGANADDYRANCSAYTAQLDALDACFRALREEAVHQTLIVADRFPLLYLCEAYGLGYRAAFHGCASDTEPSLATIRYLIDRVNNEHIGVVYAVDLGSGSIADVVAESTGAQVARLWSGQTVSRADFDAGVGYLGLMERNLDALALGLK